jgi:hypothetical protein
VVPRVSHKMPDPSILVNGGDIGYPHRNFLLADSDRRSIRMSESDTLGANERVPRYGTYYRTPKVRTVL